MGQNIQTEIKQRKPFTCREEELFLNILRTGGDQFAKAQRRSPAPPPIFPLTQYNVLRDPARRGRRGPGLRRDQRTHEFDKPLPGDIAPTSRAPARTALRPAVNSDRATGWRPWATCGPAAARKAESARITPYVYLNRRLGWSRSLKKRHDYEQPVGSKSA